MSVPGYDGEKCAQRNRIAARRDEIEGAPFSFVGKRPKMPGEGMGCPADMPIHMEGRMPENDLEAMDMINSVAGSTKKLEREDVYIHYPEAGNNNFISGRHMFLGESTLRNVAKDAEHGFAFMNSHRTGGLSTPSELPFGRTFAGRFEAGTMADGTRVMRSTVGFYMLKGVKPNGDSGPSTDDLHLGIDGGTIFDVSLGLYGGEKICDLCGNGLNERDAETGDYLCPHVPGTHRGMSQENREAQVARGVQKGTATYTLNNGRPGEVSAVFDGAVPSAGFNKMLGMSKTKQLSWNDAALARQSYATLLAKGDLNMEGEGIAAAISTGFSTLLERLHSKPADSPPTPDPSQPAVLQTPNPVLERALKLGLDTPEKLDALQSEAETGRELLSRLRTQAKAMAVTAFGPDSGKALEVSIDAMDLAALDLNLKSYTAIADAKFGYGPNGQAPPRRTVPTQLQHVAVDVAGTTPSDDQLALQREAQSIVASAFPNANGTK